MPEGSDRVNSRMLMFSIKPRWATMIAEKQKLYELRRRPPPQHAAGDVALIYATSPVCRLVCACQIEEIITMESKALWNCIGEQTGCTKAEFDSYFAGCSFANAIKLKVLEVNLPALSRIELKTEYRFTPPQSWRWCHDLSKILEKR